jgi:hypothetical protein
MIFRVLCSFFMPLGDGGRVCCFQFFVYYIEDDRLPAPSEHSVDTTPVTIPVTTPLTVSANYRSKRRYSKCPRPTRYSIRRAAAAFASTLLEPNAPLMIASKCSRFA